MSKKLKIKFAICIFLAIVLLMSGSALYMRQLKKVVYAQSTSVQQQTEPEKEKLLQQVLAYLNANSLPTTSVSVSIYDIEEKQVYEINAHDDVFSASLYKVPLAMLYYEFIADGTLQETTTLPYCSSCYEAGGPIAENYTYGDMIPLAELLYDVIVYSDNSAGHILFEYLGGWEQYRSLIQKYSTQSIFSAPEENSFSSSYAIDVLKTIYHNENLYTALLSNMSLVYPQDYLNHSLSSVAIQKYGCYGNQRNAMGIVYGDYSYLIVVLCDLGEKGVEVIGDINKIAYDYFNAK